MKVAYKLSQLAFVVLLSILVSNTAVAQQMTVDGQAAPAMQPNESIEFGADGEVSFIVTEATAAEVAAAKAATGDPALSIAGSPTMSATDGSSDYWIKGTFSAKQNCVFADNLKMTLQAINSSGGVEKSTVVNSGVGYLGSYSGVWTIYVGPGRSLTLKLTARETGGFGCDNSASKSNAGSTAALKAPKSVSASANGSDQNVTISWARGSDITQTAALYHAVYKNGSLLSYRPYANTSYSFTTTPASTDEYSVASYFAGYTTNPAKFSAKVSKTITTADFKVPGNVVATDGTTVRSVNLSWSNDSDYAASTYIYRDGALVGSVPKSITSFSDPTVTPGDPYDYCLANYRGSTVSAQGCAPDPGRSFFVRADDGTKTNNVRLDWTLTPNELSEVTNIQVLRDGQELDVKSRASTTYTDLLAEPGQFNRYDIVLRDASNNTVLADYDYGFIPADGEISGAVTSEGISSGGVRDVIIAATPEGDAYKYSLTLNGVDNLVQVDHRNSLSLGQNYSVETWLKPAQLRAQTIIAKGTSSSSGPFGLEMNADGTVTFHARNNSVSISSSTALNANQWAHVAIVQDERTNQIHLYVNGTLDGTTALQGSDGVNVLPMTIGANSDGSNPFDGNIDEMRLWSVARSDSAIVADMHNILGGGEEGLISYWRFSAGAGDAAGDFAIGGGNHGLLVGDVAWSTDQPVLSHRALTDNRGQGEFSLTGLPYGTTTSGTLYNVTPTKQNHAFDPAERFERLTRSAHLIDDSNFTDTTSVSVAGNIVFAGTICPVDSVEIRVDDIPSGLTEGGGLFAIGGIERGQHTILPVFREHSFSPASANINFTGDVTGLTFENTTTRTLAGVVAGGQCKANIGRARVTVTAPNGCFTQAVVTTDQEYTFTLPAQDYLVAVEMLDDPTINFPSRAIDLSDADSLLDFIHYAKPQIALSGFPESSCANPILEQTRVYEVLAAVTEQYGSVTCDATVGEVQIFDEVSDGVAPITVELDSTGTVRYELTAGSPNIVGGGPNPYQKRIAFAASTPGGDLTSDELVIVEGNRPREQTFTTVSPQIPLLILRDPPGDQSYSYKEQSERSCYASSLSLLAEASIGQFGKVRVGTKFEAGFGVTVETKVWGELSSSLEVGARALGQTEREICVTSTNTYATSGNQDVTGAEGDVFIGSALNLVYAITDVLDVEESANQCPISITQEIIYDNAGLATTYHYTESHIRNTVIPDLQINRELATTATAKQEFQDQIEVWQQTLDMNQRLKDNAVAMGNDFNLSFSANAPLEQSTEWSVTDRDQIDFSLYVNAEVAAEAGVEIGGVGASGGVRVKARMEVGTSRTVTTTTTNKTGFFLADDDAGDAFTVDVLRDYVYGTPVFKLAGGVSSYPHEPGTLPRDGVQLTLSPATQTLPDAAAEAEVILSLGNTGQNFESRGYELAFLQESNPFGAEVTIGGSQVQGPIPYTLDDSESRQVTLRLKRAVSSAVYDYDDLQVVLRSPFDGQFADTAAFSVHYTSPCTALTLVEPASGWLVNQASHDSLRIYIKDYSKTNLDRMRFEISPAGRNNWSDALSVSTADLPDGEAVLYWKTNNSVDKDYDLRAVAECTVDNTVARTYTERAVGVIDRASPKLFGTPEPASGVLSQGADILATFNESLDCSAVGPSNVSLKNTKTGATIATTAQCSDKTIIVEPQVDLAQFENVALQITLKDIRDSRGNKMDRPATWSFTVNRNPVYWSKSRLAAQAFEGQSVELTGRLVNSGQEAITYSLNQFPDWVTPSVTRATIEAGDTGYVTFTTSGSLASGAYNGSVIATTPEGAEPLALDLTVSCAAPDWSVDGPTFANSMSVTAGFYLQDIPFSNENDRVAAFVNGEVRGVATVQEVVPQDEYAAFLTVFSNATSGETVSFRLYDASECMERSIAETVQFQANGVVGTAAELQPYTVTGATLQTINLVKGWTWISFGVEAANMSAKSVLSQLRAKEGDVIKGQTGFSQYVNGHGWVGTLDSIKTGLTYKIQSKDVADLVFIGEPVNVDDHPIAINSGWNWVGYLPDNAIGINDALVSLNSTATTNDILKGQFAFATFNSGSWSGSLGTLVPGDGYLLKAGQSGSLVYPGASGQEQTVSTTIMASMMSAAAPPEWVVNAAQYEKSMTVTAALILDNGSSTNSESLIAAFVGNEIRGVAKPILALDKWVYFVTVYGDTDGETVSFKAYDADRDQVSDILETVTFETEGAIGAPRESKALTSTTATAVDDFDGVALTTALEQNYPNPVMGRTTLPYSIEEATEVTIGLFDTLGRRVVTIVSDRQPAGRYSISVDTSNLASGLYLYRMAAGGESFTRTLTVVR